MQPRSMLLTQSASGREDQWRERSRGGKCVQDVALPLGSYRRGSEELMDFPTVTPTRDSRASLPMSVSGRTYERRHA
jgi:hypothetical protein